MPSERSVEISRRVSDAFEILASGNGAATKLIKRLTRAKIIQNGVLEHPVEFEQTAEMVCSLANIIDEGSEISPEVISTLTQITDQSRLELFIRLIGFQEEAVPQHREDTDGFPIAFHPKKGEIAQFVQGLEPQVARQHLRLASDFFTVAGRLRQDLRSPANKIGINLIDGVQPPFNRKMQQKLFLHMLENFGDVTGDPEALNFKIVNFPRIPSFPTRHIDIEELDQLALEVFRYMLTGETTSSLLTRTSADVKKPIGSVLKEKFVRAPKALRSRLEKAGEHALIIAENDSGLKFNPIAYLPDILSNEELENDPVVQKLKNARIILMNHSEHEKGHMDAFRKWFTGGHRTSDNNVFRQVALQPGMFNASVGHILRKVCVEKERDFGRHALLSQLIGRDMPGISTPEQFLQSVRSARGSDSMNDILIFYFSNLTDLHYPRLMQILGTLFHHQVEVPAQCKEQIIKRFNVDPSLLDKFERLSKRYHPVILTELPEEIDLRSEPEFYLNTPEDILGMEPEADALAQKLIEHDAVALVDTTMYGQGIDYNNKEESKKKMSYVNPQMRALNAFIYRVMNGEYKELDGYSIASLDDEDDLMDFLLFLFGRDTDDDDDILTEEERKSGLKPTEDKRTEVKRMEDQLMALKRFNNKIILVLDPISDYDVHSIATIIKYLKRFDIKIIYNCTQVAASMPQVRIEPFNQAGIERRLVDGSKSIEEFLNVSMEPSVLSRLPAQIERMRHNPLDDPLDATMRVLYGASAAAHARELSATASAKITGADITNALAYEFNSIDPILLASITDQLEFLPKQLGENIAGQEPMIHETVSIFGDHFKGLRPAHRPSSVLITGPTGVGKTELIKGIAKHFSIPYLHLEGGDFTESHHTDMLTGSPPGYKDEGDGTLTRFMERHPELAIVFMDELHKAHSSFRQLFNNILWTGRVCNKHGKEFHRPGYIYISATNAGADQIHPGMDTRKIHEVLAKEFSNEGGRAEPEFVARFQLIHAHPIAEGPFRQAIKWGLRDMETFPALQSFDIQIGTIDDAAIELIFQEVKQSCTYQGRSDFGFGKSQVQSEIRQYFNLRQVSFAQTRLSRKSASALVRKISKEGASCVWPEGQPHIVNIGVDGKQIILKPVVQ